LYLEHLKGTSGILPSAMSGDWTFLSLHAQVLICLARDADARLRDVAERVGVSERTVQAVVNDLVEAGYVTRTRTGRRNRYAVHADRPLRHRMQQGIDAGTLLRLAVPPRRRRGAADDVAAAGV
jgi:DNA-binding Lrp family transcriptional regulator